MGGLTSYTGDMATGMLDSFSLEDTNIRHKHNKHAIYRIMSISQSVRGGRGDHEAPNNFVFSTIYSMEIQMRNDL